MPRSTMKVALIRHTLSPEEVVALGARLCYSRATVDSLQQRVSRDDQSEFVSRILSMGHESVLEHASFMTQIAHELMARGVRLDTVPVTESEAVEVFAKALEGGNGNG